MPFPRRPSGDLLRLPANLRRAVRAAEDAIDSTGAEVVVGFGGYVSTPAYLAARRRGTPVVVHEQNARPGLANRLGARFAAGVGVTFPGTRLPHADPHRDAVAPRDRDARPRRPPGRGARAVRARRRPDGARHRRLARRPAAQRRLRRRGRRPVGGRRAGAARRRHGQGVHPGGEPARPTWCSSTATGWTSPTRPPTWWSRAPAPTRSASSPPSGCPPSTCPLPVGNGEQRLNAAAVVAAGGGILVDDAAVDAGVGRGTVRPARPRRRPAGHDGRGRRLRRAAWRRRAAGRPRGHRRRDRWAVTVPAVNARFPFRDPVPAVADLGRVHLVAIGGAGMSGVARLLLGRGVVVSGCDTVDGPATAALRHDGARVEVGHDAAHLDDVDTVVVSSAIRDDNVELAAARAAGLRVLHRSQALASLMGDAASRRRRRRQRQDDDDVDARRRARGLPVPTRRSPSGGEIAPARHQRRARGRPGLRRRGRRERRLVPRLPPRRRRRHERAARPPRLLRHGRGGRAGLRRLRRVRRRRRPRSSPATTTPGRAAWPTRRAPPAAPCSPTATTRGRPAGRRRSSSHDLGTRSVLVHDGVDRVLDLAVPGDHNVMDACAAYLAAVVGLGAPTRRPCSPGSPGSRGARRRFEVRGEVGGVTVVDDYAHNPAKVAAVVGTASEIVHRAGSGSLRVVFQPHLYSPHPRLRRRTSPGRWPRPTRSCSSTSTAPASSRSRASPRPWSATRCAPCPGGARCSSGPPATRPSRRWPTPPGPATSCSPSGPATSPPSPRSPRRPASAVAPGGRHEPRHDAPPRRARPRRLLGSANRFRERALSNRRRPWLRALLVVAFVALAALVGWLVWLEHLCSASTTSRWPG